jgi:recombination protein RecT
MTPAALIGLVKEQEGKFTELAHNAGDAVNFAQECLFARQQLLKNDFTLKTAAKNPNSLQAAILNVAAIGISLNPASTHAYLVPRDGAICLDISFKGLVKLATDCGAIKYAKAELVYENDHFEWCGPTTPPMHRADPFGERGPIKGGYCLAKMPDGEYMVEVMSVDEINKVRDTSKAFKAGKGPWVDWYAEMAKKTIIKRAYKSWPQTEARQRLDKAVEVLNEHEGMAYTIEEHGEYLKYLREGDALGFYLMRRRLPDHVWIALYNSGEKGQKVKMKQEAAELEKAGIEQFNAVKEAIAEAVEQKDPTGLQEVVDELSPAELDGILPELTEEQQQAVTAMKEAA